MNCRLEPIRIFFLCFYFFQMSLSFHQFPPFKSLNLDEVPAAIDALVESTKASLAQIEASPSHSYNDVVIPLCALSDQISSQWGVISHLMGVMNSDTLRQVHNKAQPLIVRVSTLLEQSKPIYDKLVALKSSPEFATLSTSEKRVVELRIRDAELSGVHLEGNEKDQFNAIEEKLAALASKFADNVLDSIKSYARQVSESELEGVPESVKGIMKKNAEEKKMDGFVITLDYPVYIPLMKFAKNRALREEVYKAFLTVASTSEYSNHKIVEEILALKQERALLLGLPTHAHVSLKSKAISDDPEDVLAFLSELRTKAKPAAVKEFEQICEYARTVDPDTFGESQRISQWDQAFYIERIKETTLNLNEEELRPFFELQSVLKGLFGIVKQAFGVDILSLSTEQQERLGITTWHEDCQCFEIKNNQTTMSYLIVDPYSRPATKRSGAWMDNGVVRDEVTGPSVRLPLVYVVCNFTPPTAERPSLLTFNEATTLFHEFGHALNGALTTEGNPAISCINGVEWDCVEVPSQLLENFLYDVPTVQRLAKHYITGEPLDIGIIENLKRLRQFMEGLQTMRQLLFATTDMYLHYLYVPDVKRASDFTLDTSMITNSVATARSAHEVYHFAAKDHTLIPPLPEDYFLCQFKHIFAGYSAGYFSYKYAECLSADAWYAFEEVLGDEAKLAEVGKRFRDTILAQGGARDALTLFKLFRGRDVDISYLLKMGGLLALESGVVDVQAQ
ncbi:hypothetical protein RCL1_002049 [Eukaryota sp. TZLM3-RCL]